MNRRVATILGICLGVGALAIQLVPYRVQHPPVVQGPAWDDPATEALARRACFDCHSNETKVPWYGHVAPFAWIVRHHVDDARERLNFSEMHLPQRDADEAAEMVRERIMPPGYYVSLHAGARMTPDERDALARGLAATLGAVEEEHHDED